MRIPVLSSIKRRGLLLDRDGVINVDHGYVSQQGQFQFLPELFPFLRSAQDLGFRLAILTNQSGVARGMYTVADFEKLTGWMRLELAKQGIVIDLILACFEHDAGNIAPFNRESFWRKPNPGMVLEAVQRLQLDPARSAFIGDKTSDMESAKAGGIGKRLLLTPHASEQTNDVTIVQNFDEALKVLNATSHSEKKS